MSEGPTTDSKFAEARDSLQQTLGKLRGCSDRERKEMQREFSQLNEMLSKLQHYLEIRLNKAYSR